MNANQSIYLVNRDTAIVAGFEPTKAVSHVWRMILRDHKTVFGQSSPDVAARGAASILVRYAEPDDECPEWPEAFCFRFKSSADGHALHIAARDELGLMFGMLHYSREVLGVDPFWYWADLPPKRRESIAIPANDYDSVQPKVRYRGWFVNDEVCLIGWKAEYPPTREVWEPVFEALLRCGGNMVIPGTDLPKSGVHAQLAAEMGLWITHHHAEPLGAEMFLRAYPGNNASYREHPGLFEQLWREAIEKQKNERVVWVLSFRGQGDKPFWENDPEFDTPSSRGAHISAVVRKQYELVRQGVAEPVCCMALYGEIAELFRAGHIEVPEDVIKIWADNGYGKMVSRRHGNLNLRVPALPPDRDSSRNGIYYHVTFHDLQASNHLTLFPSAPELIADELGKAFEAGASAYLLLNCGNIRPHIYTLDLVAEMWNKGEAGPDEHLKKYVNRMFHLQDDSNVPLISDLFRAYFDSTIRYGPHPDDRAGEEFYHHPAREIVGHWLQGKVSISNERLQWAAGDGSFPEQVRWFAHKAAAAVDSWAKLERRIMAVVDLLPDGAGTRLHDQLLLPVRLHLSGCRGLKELGRAFEAYMGGSYPLAFVHATQSLQSYSEGLTALREAEHGRWENFYQADWLTNIANTVGHMDTLRRYIRMHGDSPDMFQWYKAYIMPESEKHIYLENTHRNPLSDDRLAELLQAYFEREDASRFM